MTTVAILSIGTEVVRGELVNTNAAWIANQLAESGFEVVEQAVVVDDVVQIQQTLRRLSQYEVLVSTGGLGPTRDDLTSEAVAGLLSVPMVKNEKALSAIESFVKARGGSWNSLREKQAYFPDNATVLPNAVGTAPGFSVHVDQAHAFFLPGVPHEMRVMFESWVMPIIRSRLQSPTSVQRFRTYGWGESAIAQQLLDLEAGAKEVTFGYRAMFPEVEIKLLYSNEPEARTEAARIALRMRQLLDECAFGNGDQSLPEFVAMRLIEKGTKVAVAESCTGGLLAKLLTDQAGASASFDFGAITYSNEAKIKVLSVDPDTLQTHGAVSEQVARQMAEGARQLSDADIALSITGIAGPNGGSEDKPVGTVCFGIALKHGATSCWKQHFSGNRAQIRTRAAYDALWGVTRTSVFL